MKRKILNLISVFRPLRWYRNSFMLAGAILAIHFHGVSNMSVLVDIGLAFIAACFIASGNYGINEILDKDNDKFHPEKKNRPSVKESVSTRVIFLFSVMFYGGGFVVAYSTGNMALLCMTGVFFLSGFFYNVKPFRFKELPYLDFSFEALNNPIRLLIGWYATTSALVPSSFLLCFWFIGIFLMAAKRFGEYRYIQDKKTMILYRKSQ